MKYGFIGCGNMGSALAGALAKATTDIILTDRSGNGKNLANSLGCQYASLDTVASNCNHIFLAVKPQMMETVLVEISGILQEKKPLLITMAAGLTTQQIQDYVGTPLPIIRIMPNTPVAVGCGVIPYCYNSLVQENMIADFLNDMRFAGYFDNLPEKLIDAATALSGSGPAYFYLLLDALADGAVSCGMPKEKALKYAAHTMLGAAQMLLNSDKHPSALKDAVCSPGGSTIAGIKVLEEQGVRGSIMDCVAAAYNRNLELGK